MIQKGSEILDLNGREKRKVEVPIVFPLFCFNHKKKQCFIFCYYAGGKSLEKVYFVKVSRGGWTFSDNMNL